LLTLSPRQGHGFCAMKERNMCTLLIGFLVFTCCFCSCR
jgi:hypothetical protein